METRKNRIPAWLMLVGFAIFLPFVVAGAVWEYMSATATPLHPDAASVPTAFGSAAPPRWDEAVEQARQQVRADLVERNLPGLSVAVGVGGDIVWAEGFGWADLENQIKVTPEMRFRIGTASTALTSAAVGLLLEKGRLTLDEKIQTYVPEFLCGHVHPRHKDRAGFREAWKVDGFVKCASPDHAANDGGRQGARSRERS